MASLNLDAYCTGCDSDQHTGPPTGGVKPDGLLWCSLCWQWQRPLAKEIKDLARRGQKVAESEATDDNFKGGPSA